MPFVYATGPVAGPTRASPRGRAVPNDSRGQSSVLPRVSASYTAAMQCALMRGIAALFCYQRRREAPGRSRGWKRCAPLARRRPAHRAAAPDSWLTRVPSSPFTGSILHPPTQLPHIERSRIGSLWGRTSRNTMGSAMRRWRRPRSVPAIRVRMAMTSRCLTRRPATPVHPPGRSDTVGKPLMTAQLPLAGAPTPVTEASR
jgi:hypothetical protein